MRLSEFIDYHIHTEISHSSAVSDEKPFVGISRSNLEYILCVVTAKMYICVTLYSKVPFYNIS